MRTDAEIDAEKAKKEAVNVARADKAIAAAEAMLAQFGFKRYIPGPKQAEKGFNMWGPAVWHKDSPRMSARLHLQAKAWNNHGDDSYVYRLDLCADSAFGVKNSRIAPGNAEGVKAYLGRVDAARAEQEKHEQKDAKTARLVEEMLAHDYPHLKVSRVEVRHGQVDVFVKTKDGIGLVIALVEFRFLSIKVDPYEERTTALDNLKKALRAL
jgi:hypothetical protein